MGDIPITPLQGFQLNINSFSTIITSIQDFWFLFQSNLEMDFEIKELYLITNLLTDVVHLADGLHLGYSIFFFPHINWVRRIFLI